jgi:hypothetical protein
MDCVYIIGVHLKGHSSNRLFYFFALIGIVIDLI